MASIRNRGGTRLEKPGRNISDMQVGDRTPDVKYTITNEQIRDYAAISTDNNPLHVDEEFAKKTVFKGIIAHGTIPLAYLFQTVYEYFGVPWINGITYEVKFIAPVRPRDEVVCNGVVKSIDEAGGNVCIELNCMNQNEAKVIVGKAVIPVI